MKLKGKLLNILIGIAVISIVLFATVFTIFKFSGSKVNVAKDDKSDRTYVEEVTGATLADNVSLPSVTMEEDLNPEDAVVSVTLNDTQTEADISIDGISPAAAVCIAVWSENEGQDDIRWYDMEKSETGIFDVNISIKEHHDEGTYKADAYVIRSDGTKYIICNTEFQIEGPKLDDALITDINNNTGSFEIKILGASSVSSARKAKVRLYPSGNKDNVFEYEADIDESGNASISANVSNHGYISGIYIGEVTIVDGNDINKKLKEVTADINLPQMVISTSKNSSETNVKISVSNIIEDSVSEMSFDVYSKSGGKDDLVSYPGTKMSSSSYEASAVISNHHTAGEYIVDIYAKRISGEKELIGSTTFSITSPNAGTLLIPVKSEDDEYFTVAVNGASSLSSVTEIKFKVVRCSDGKENWYQPESVEQGNATVTVDIKDQIESVENYSVTAYIKDANGIQISNGPVDLSMTLINNGKYKIMGATRTSVAQMIKYFKANGSYPQYYANSDAPTIEAFCQIFYDEAATEGVRAEVAFCQTMKETGYLKFGNDVDISQYNFAGIGATGNGEAGYSFSSVREGVRAQIQHLKAYASTDSLNSACVDPRFSFVKRSSAVYVEWLGIQENPNGGGWAASAGYGPSIVNSYIKKLFSY